MSSSNQTTGRSDTRRAVGARMEEHARKKYGLLPDHSGRADAEYPTGAPVEIKSAIREKSAGRGRGTKEGEFFLFETPHRWLRRNDGWYVFVVYEPRSSGVKVLDTKRIHSSRLPRLSWHQASHAGRGTDDRECRIKISEIFG